MPRTLQRNPGKKYSPIWAPGVIQICLAVLWMRSRVQKSHPTTGRHRRAQVALEPESPDVFLKPHRNVSILSEMKKNDVFDPKTQF